MIVCCSSRSSSTEWVNFGLKVSWQVILRLIAALVRTVGPVRVPIRQIWALAWSRINAVWKTYPKSRWKFEIISSVLTIGQCSLPISRLMAWVASSSTTWRTWCRNRMRIIRKMASLPLYLPWLVWEKQSVGRPRTTARYSGRRWRTIRAFSCHARMSLRRGVCWGIGASPLC